MTSRMRFKVPIEKIEKEALAGKNVNRYFTKGRMMQPLKEIQRVNVDFTAQMLGELDQLAAELNISRQAVIKSLLMFALNQQRLAAQRGDGPADRAQKRQ